MFGSKKIPELPHSLISGYNLTRKSMPACVQEYGGSARRVLLLATLHKGKDLLLKYSNLHYKVVLDNGTSFRTAFNAARTSSLTERQFSLYCFTVLLSPLSSMNAIQKRKLLM